MVNQRITGGLGIKGMLACFAALLLVIVVGGAYAMRAQSAEPLQTNVVSSAASSLAASPQAASPAAN